MKYLLDIVLINLIKNIIADKDGDIKDIKEIITYNYGFKYILIILASAALILLFIFYRKKKVNITKKEITALPPDVIALDKIKKLKELKLAEQGRIKEFYTILSDIIRKFLEDKFKISALDLTSYELVFELKNKNIIYGNVGIVQNFLFDCDLVKFAKFVPPAENSEKILNLAEKIINISKNDQAGNYAEIKKNV